MSSSPTNAASFLQVLDRSQLLSAAARARASALLRGNGHSANRLRQSATLTAERLVADGLLTRWQADKLLQGKSRGFFLGPYRLLYKVARGGMSTIYAGQHAISGQLRALKVLPLSKADKASYLPRFVREAEIAKSLRHPNIVEVFDVHSESDGVSDVHFMAMELLSGRDLAEIVHTDGPLPCREAADYIRQAARGLSYAHGAGMVHRDVKPGNLFLGNDHVIRILDLGLAQQFDTDESLTREYNERVLGTADYLAPEQAVDSHTADSRADLYSLGCTFYFLLTARPPFGEGSLTQRILAHQSRSPIPLKTLRDDVPDEIQTLIEQMMVKARNHRIQTAAEVEERLAGWLAMNSADGSAHHTTDRPRSRTHTDHTADARTAMPIVVTDRSSAGESRSGHGDSSDSLLPASIPEAHPAGTKATTPPPTDAILSAETTAWPDHVGTREAAEIIHQADSRNSEVADPTETSASDEISDVDSTAVLTTRPEITEGDVGRNAPQPDSATDAVSAADVAAVETVQDPTPAERSEPEADFIRPKEPRRAAPASSPYRPEFERFLRYLDRESGANTIMTSEARGAQLTALADAMPDADEPCLPDESSETVPSFTGDPGPNVGEDGPKNTRRSSFVVALLLMALLSGSLVSAAFLWPDRFAVVRAELFRLMDSVRELLPRVVRVP